MAFTPANGSRTALAGLRVWFLLGAAVSLRLFAALPLDHVTLQLKWHHQFQFAGYYAAQDQGYYREAGLEVDIREGVPGINVVKEVVSGNAQFGVGTSALLLARQKGMPVVVLAAVFQHSPLVLMAKAGGGITSVQDLAGKRVMIEDSADELIAYLRKEGVPESSLTLVPHSFEAGDLISGKVACMSAYVTDEPFFLKNTHLETLVFSPRMGGIDFYGDNLFTTAREVKEHPARTRAFREASMRGWKYAMQHPEAITDLILSRYGEGRGRAYLLYEARQMVPLLQPGLVDLGYMYPGRWQHIVDTYAELGLLPRNFQLDGFLYDPAASDRQDHRRLVLAMVAALMLGTVFGGVALVFLRLNLRLKREIASRERAEAGKAALQAHLLHSQKMESMGSLAGGVAHDMNNVLGAILGMASANLEDHPAGSAAHRAFATIIKAADRGGKMVKGLLSFARVSPAEVENQDLNAIIREEVEFLERTTLARVELRLALAPDLKPIRGDGGALNHLLMNLFVNAVDAMPEQGVLSVRTRNLEEGWIEIQVEDTGCGMAPEVLARAMDPFFTTKPQGQGTGLGLSMVYSTVKAHQGRLDLESEPGQGTRVRIRFPASGAAGLGEPGPDPASLEPSHRGLQVLLVDDDELIRSSMESVLEALGHQALEASSGEEALRLLAMGLPPDLVIMDMNMPGLGGKGTLPLLRARWPDLPVLLATGLADQSVLDLVAAHTKVALLTKPFSMKDFQQALGSLARS